MDYNILFPTFEFKEGIPRKINQIYIVQEGKNEDLPDIILDNISFLKRNNPQWVELLTLLGQKVKHKKLTFVKV